MHLKNIAVATIAVVGMFLASGECKAQPSTKLARIGVMVQIAPGPPWDEIRQRLVQDLAQLGYIEGRDIAIEARFAHNQADRLPELAAELVRLDVDIILALGGVSAHPAAKATTKIPVIFLIVTDPVAIGLVSSYERPGANVTGITSLDPQQVSKQLALLKEVLPNLKRVAILSDPTLPGADARGWVRDDREADAAATKLGLQAQIVKVKGGATPDLEGAFAEMAEQGAEALLMLEAPVALVHRKRIAELAATHRMPTIFPGSLADANGMITFGTNFREGYRRLPFMIDKILKGAKPMDTPVDVVTRSQLIVNIKAARQIGVNIPDEVRKRANQVIE